MWMDGYKKAKNYILKQREKAPNCKVCGVKLFDYNTLLDEYFYKDGNAIKLSPSDVNRIYLEMYDNYPYSKEDNLCKIRHHLNYMFDVTIFVCGTCHGKIHGTKLEKYAKYKPTDKRPYNYR